MGEKEKWGLKECRKGDKYALFTLVLANIKLSLRDRSLKLMIEAGNSSCNRYHVLVAYMQLKSSYENVLSVHLQ